MRVTGGTLAAAAAVLIVAGVAGCTSSSNTATPTDTTTVTVPASGPATTAPSSPATGPATTPTTAPATPPPAQVAGAQCATSSLTGRLTQSSGAAGTTYTNVALTNHSSVSCTIQGWPGVSFVGDGNGTQIGASATLDRTSAHPTLTLAPGATGYALLAITGYNASSCNPTTADGVRVYPPGQRASLFITWPYHEACTGVGELRVGAFQAAAQ